MKGGYVDEFLTALAKWQIMGFLLNGIKIYLI
jgi:hypothetical protein